MGELVIRPNFEEKLECPRCSAEKETLFHVLEDCPIARAILFIGGLDNSLITKDYHCCIDWLEDVIRVLNKRATTNLMITLWNSWNNRNNFIFRGKEEEAHVVWERGRTLSKDFRIFSLINDPLLPANPAVKRWEKHPRGYVKINFDASVSNNRTGFGVIARDDEGFVIDGGEGLKNEMILAELAEIYTFEESIKMVCALNIKTIVVFETDNASLVNRVKHHSTDVTIFGARVVPSFGFFASASVAS
ncbi:uncharacterized protein [Gossypium hirsutum]|uniref:RNase H type-1 domain-containing protein n=1 Tax=Gossypium hirsutum TaxID=3635 RepID=A0A1U8NN13_GOSHI|nr:uncharacterized protein LOC107950023 [Gossypium hirsutum]